MRRDESRIYKVLFSAVRDYIKSKRPVSSKRILEITKLSWSSATIRNDLKRLEELGYLYQPHTSAGRIPTDRGLRFYLDEMLKLQNGIRRDDLGIDMVQRFPVGDLEMILTALTRILASAGKGLAIVTKPSLEKMRLVKVSVTPIGDEYSVVSVITELGVSRVIPVPKMSDLMSKAVERFFNVFSGKTLAEMVEAINQFVPDSARAREIVDVAKSIIDMATSEGRVIYKGIYELLKGSNHSVEDVVRILEESTKFEEFLEGIDDMRVFIGSESPLDETKSFSLFVSPYKKDRDITGHVAMITDRFVEYEKIYSLVEFMANRLTEYLTVVSRR